MSCSSAHAASQLLDHSLSSGLGVRRVYYGAELMEPKSDGSPELQGSDLAKYAAKAAVLPVMAGSIESIAANRAEVQRYYGIEKFAKIEKALGSGFARKACGPAFRANAARNATMSMTSFVVAPTIYKFLCPQESSAPLSRRTSSRRCTLIAAAAAAPPITPIARRRSTSHRNLSSGPRSESTSSSATSSPSRSRRCGADRSTTSRWTAADGSTTPRSCATDSRRRASPPSSRRPSGSRACS